jgi:hypothetical protein
MTGCLRARLLAICLTLILVQGVPAFNVSQLTVEPSGDVIPKTTIILTGTIDFIPSSDETFASSLDEDWVTGFRYFHVYL